MESIIVLLIVLIAFSFCAIAAVLIINYTTKSGKRRNDIHISGGADIETGRISSDDNFFKGISGDIEQTYFVENNHKIKNSLDINVTILNLKTSESNNVLISKKLIIGRESGEGVFTISNDKTVSKTHCMIYVYSDKLYICDLNSANHTYLNGSVIKSSVICNSGDVIKVGNTKLKIIY